MKDIEPVLIGVMGGCAITLAFLAGTKYQENHHFSVNLINECQQELPRNETCKVIAIPDEGGKDE